MFKNSDSEINTTDLKKHLSVNHCFSVQEWKMNKHSTYLFWNDTQPNVCWNGIQKSLAQGRLLREWAHDFVHRSYSNSFTSLQDLEWWLLLYEVLEFPLIFCCIVIWCRDWHKWLVHKISDRTRNNWAEWRMIAVLVNLQKVPTNLLQETIWMNH